MFFRLTAPPPPRGLDRALCSLNGTLEFVAFCLDLTLALT